MKSFLCLLPHFLLHQSCQNGTAPENGSALLHPRAKGNICESGGVSGEHAAQRAPTTEGILFLLPYFILNVKLFTLQWHPKMILLLALLQLKQYFFMLHRVPSSWSAMGPSLPRCHENKNKGKERQIAAGKNAPFSWMFYIHSPNQCLLQF